MVWLDKLNYYHFSRKMRKNSVRVGIGHSRQLRKCYSWSKAATLVRKEAMNYVKHSLTQYYLLCKGAGQTAFPLYGRDGIMLPCRPSVLPLCRSIIAVKTAMTLTAWKTKQEFWSIPPTPLTCPVHPDLFRLQTPDKKLPLASGTCWMQRSREAPGDRCSTSWGGGENLDPRRLERGNWGRRQKTKERGGRGGAIWDSLFSQTPYPYAVGGNEVLILLYHPALWGLLDVWIKNCAYLLPCPETNSLVDYQGWLAINGLSLKLPQIHLIF